MMWETNVVPLLVRSGRQMMGEQRYRDAVMKLPPEARAIVRMFEERMDPDTIIHQMAWKYHRGCGFGLTEDDLRAAREEFLMQIPGIMAAINAAMAGGD